tara:strand:- start:698 stop:1252 length:555 start_codon:yes stop_codon:yes gene_type:complete
MNLFKDFDTSQLINRTPPTNNSLQTFKELKQLKSMRIDKDFVVEKDNIIKNFEKINKKFGLNFPNKKITKLQNDSSKIIKILKNYFNRPRPKEIAAHLGIKIKNTDLKSMKTPSYPSGHSAQSKLIANVLSDKFPQLKYHYQKEADDISDSRNIGRAHFQSDSSFGKELGDRLYMHLKHKGYVL